MAPKDEWTENLGRLMDIIKQIDECLEKLFPGITHRGKIIFQSGVRSAILEVQIVLPDEPAKAEKGLPFVPVAGGPRDVPNEPLFTRENFTAFMNTTKDIDKRYQTAAEFHEDIQRFLSRR